MALSSRTGNTPSNVRSLIQSLPGSQRHFDTSPMQGCLAPRFLSSLLSQGCFDRMAGIFGGTAAVFIEGSTLKRHTSLTPWRGPHWPHVDSRGGSSRRIWDALILKNTGLVLTCEQAGCGTLQNTQSCNWPSLPLTGPTCGLALSSPWFTYFICHFRT